MNNLAKTQSRAKYTRHTILTCTKLVPCRQNLNSVHIPTATQTTKYFSGVQRTHTTSPVTHVPTNDTAPIFYLRNLLLLSLFLFLSSPLLNLLMTVYTEILKRMWRWRPEAARIYLKRTNVSQFFEAKERRTKILFGKVTITVDGY